MNTKLTLNLEKNIIEKAKKYAREKNISLSKMIEFYLKSIIRERKEKIDITPFVESLSGVIHLSDKDYMKDYSNYLNEKYK